jgi:hypothetical protein
MGGKIDFSYDAANDMVIAVSHWHVETEGDLEPWYREWADYFEKNFPGRRMDMVVELTDFQVNPAIASRWGEYRALIHKNFTRFSYRVHSNSRVRLFVNTSGVRFDASTSEAATIEDGIAAILQERLRAGEGSRPPKAG